MKKELIKNSKAYVTKPLVKEVIMNMQISKKGQGIDVEDLYRAGIDALGYEKPQVAQILFKKASILGHKEATRFVEILEKCHGNEKA